MYSREKRLKAVELYIKYDKSAADVIRELGYPDRHTLNITQRESRLSPKREPRFSRNRAAYIQK